MIKGKTAVITGATSGIGTTFARTIAKEGWNLIITGRRKDRLVELREEFSLAFGVHVKIVNVDFNSDQELDCLLDTINKSDNIKLLINNAGFGSIGDYFESNYEIQQKMVNVHIKATTKIVHQTIPKMIENGGGSIINVASLSAFLPAPKSYFYCSSKAFLVTFSECLHIDLAHRNINVQALCPGFTNTEFHSRQGITQSDNYIKKKILWQSPQTVVDKSLNSLKKNNVICIPGFFNRILYHASKIMPRAFYYKLAIRNSHTFLKQAPHHETLIVKKKVTAELN